MPRKAFGRTRCGRRFGAVATTIEYDACMRCRAIVLAFLLTSAVTVVTASADVAPLTTEPGEGTCKTDAECVVSNTLDADVVGDHACCSYICPPGRVVSTEIQRRLDARRAAVCARPKLCPPPAPCPRATKTLTPKCVAGRCVADVTLLPPPKPDPTS